MSVNEKTHAEIIAECYHNTASTQYVRKLLDRLEAANKRERGDCAKLREALENLYDQICHGETEQHVAANRQMIRTALAAPPRNCEVGTAEEQTERFEAFCSTFYKEICRCDDCPIFKAKRGKAGNHPRCQIAWAQMPYEEGGAK